MAAENIEAVKATVGRIIGVDFGEVRTGVAVSDEARLLASGIGFIKVGGLHKTADKIAEIAAEYKAAAIAVGVPVNMNGSEGDRARRCRDFAAEVAEKTGLPVCTIDERMTTMAAARFLNETNTRGKKRKNVIDSLSAEIILQNCLDRLKTTVL